MVVGGPVPLPTARSCLRLHWAPQVTPERYAAIRSLFDSVVDLSSAEREQRLRQMQVEPDLLKEVLKLLMAADQGITGRISRPLGEALARASAPVVQAGDVIGVWKISGEIGQGGMGSVYSVERNDGHFTQRAALKFVKGLPDAESLDFFTRERQILATLKHPNIARLIDGGATQSGHPYFVMDHVDGVAIDKYCLEQRPSEDKLFELFITACDAVAFAHRQLIVHCDLKPSNLLVDREGRPMLLDFGIARLVDRAEPDAGDEAGSPLSAAFTPRYASPEQRAGLPVSTVSDIFSLGILLREVVDAAQLGNAELAAIAAKASEKKPADRYSSVDALIEDIHRYRERLPLHAQPATTAYVAKKFIVRRWPLVVAGGVVALIVAGFAVRLTIESQRAHDAEQAAVKARDSATAERDRAQAAEQRAVKERDATLLAQAETTRERDAARRERDRATVAEAIAAMQRNAARVAEASAVQERDRARLAEAASRQTIDFLISIFDSSNPDAQSGDIPASRLIATAELRVERALQGQPATQAEIYSALGVVQANMGRAKEGKANLQRAIALERKFSRPLVLAEMLARYDRIVSASEGAAVAEPYAKEALALRERFAGADSRELAVSRASMAVTASETGRREEAERLFEQSLAVLTRHYPNHTDTADTYASFAQHFRTYGDLTRAARWFERSVQVGNVAYGESHPSHLANYEWYGRTLSALRRFAEAEVALRRTLELRRILHGSESIFVSNVMAALGHLYLGSDRPREALEILKEAEPIVAKVAGKVSMKYAESLAQFASAYNRIGNYADAARIAEEAVEVLQKVNPNGAPLPTVLMNLGTYQTGSNQMDAAYRNLVKADEMIRARFGERHVLVISSKTFLAIWYVRANRFDEASLQLDAVKELLPPDQPVLRLNYDRQRAMIAAGRGDFDTAIAALEKLEADQFKARGNASPGAWLSMIDRAEVLAKRGGHADKEKSVQLATEILSRLGPTYDPASSVILRLKQLQQQ
jgi:eukaryotic-like serine/threonine-protein kinase